MDFKTGLKRASGFVLVLGILSFLFSWLVLLYGCMKGEFGYIVLGALSVLGAIFNIFRAVAGYKAIQGKWLMGAVVLGWLAVVGDGLSLLISMLSPRRIIIRVLYLVISVLYVFCAQNLIKEEKAEVGLPEETVIKPHKDTIDEEAEKFFN